MSLDVIIVGGGLSGGLLAWRLHQRHPQLRLRLIDVGDRLGGNHTWSFFATDLSPEQQAWIDPLVVHRWPRYDVRFPNRQRRVDTPYRSVTSERLGSVIAGALGDAVILGAAAATMSSRDVVLANGERLRAACVIDARGQRPAPGLLLGCQKFLGLEVRLAAPHGLELPVIMDATVAQHDGYRFVYTLPLDATRLLIEDTYYSDHGALAVDALRARTHQYAADQGWSIAEVLREERGVLPTVLAGDYDRYMQAGPDSPIRIGLAAALFHPTTGYSLPDAVRLADHLAEAVRPGAVSAEAVRAFVDRYGRSVWDERAYFRLLNRMLYRAGRPEDRVTVFERFYGLDQGLMERFYAAGLTVSDKLRLVLGKPPVPIVQALRCLSEERMLQQSEMRR